MFTEHVYHSAMAASTIIAMKDFWVKLLYSAVFPRWRAE